MSIFKCKQFEVVQTGCAMKVNTDGVLLGAVAHHPNPARILDIGTGTGIIALMLAQRFQSATIEAIDIDPSAAARADSNFKCSAFASRLKAFSTSFQEFYTENRYDMILSNPPFFVNDLKNPEPRKGLSRHTDMLFFDFLLQRSAVLLTDTGLLWLILPLALADELIEKAVINGLFLSERINICSFHEKAAFRQIVCFSKIKRAVKPDEIVIYAAPGVHSAQYNSLLKDFFLAL